MDDGTRGNNESLWWQDLKVVFHQSQQGNVFQNGIAWRVGCRDKIKLWEDSWTIDDVPLITKYPRLYHISCQQKQFIQQMGSHTDAGWEWNFIWRRSLIDNEIDMADSFLGDIVGSLIQPHKRDNWVWKAYPNGQYSAQSAYNLLMGESIDENLDGIFEELWKLKIPSKTSFLHGG